MVFSLEKTLYSALFKVLGCRESCCWAFPGENHLAVSSLWGRTEGQGGHSPSQGFGIHRIVMERFGLKGGRKAEGRGVGEGQKTKAQTPAALPSLASLGMPNAPSRALLSRARFVLPGHGRRSRAGCPGRAWTAPRPLAAPLPSNGQSRERVRRLPGREMPGFLPPPPSRQH